MDRKKRPKTINIPHDSVFKVLATEDAPETERILSGIGELDRFLGGGFVPGTVILLAGDPGIGKSTLTSQLCDKMSGNGKVCMYISGEENEGQVRIRQKRLMLKHPLLFTNETSVRKIIHEFRTHNHIDLVVVDSIQSMLHDAVSSAPGSTAQVRACAEVLAREAKAKNIILVLICHINKEGIAAGPKAAEHYVDVVAYFETRDPFRELRATKNRFGDTDTSATFQMTSEGLVEAPHLEKYGMTGIVSGNVGITTFIGVEKARSYVVDIQVSAERRRETSWRASGFERQRLDIIIPALLKVLEREPANSICGLKVHVPGEVRIRDHAADLAVAAAILSAFSGKPLPPKTLILGEIDLHGNVRQIKYIERRLKEAKRLGYLKVLMPSLEVGNKNTQKNQSFTFEEIDHLEDLLTALDIDYKAIHRFFRKDPIDEDEFKRRDEMAEE